METTLFYAREAADYPFEPVTARMERVTRRGDHGVPHATAAAVAEFLRYERVMADAATAVPAAVAAVRVIIASRTPRSATARAALTSALGYLDAAEESRVGRVSSEWLHLAISEAVRGDAADRCEAHADIAARVQRAFAEWKRAPLDAADGAAAKAEWARLLALRSAADRAAHAAAMEPFREILSSIPVALGFGG